MSVDANLMAALAKAFFWQELIDSGRVKNMTELAKAEKIDFSIDAQGARFWNGQPISREEAATRFQAEALKPVQPEVHLRADQAVAYKLVAETLADASRVGLSKIGFVTDPSLATPAP